MPDGTSWMKEFHRFGRQVGRSSGNSLTVRFYPGAVMGDERDVIAKMRRGWLEGGVLAGAGLGQLLPEVRVLELPFLFRDGNEYHAVRQQLRPRFERGLRERGFVLLAWGDQGWVRAYATAPIRTPKQLHQRKTWAWADDPLARAMVRELGVPSVPLAVQGVLPALQSGVVDTVYGSAYLTLAMQWHTQLNAYSTTRFIYANGAVLLDRRVFDALSASQRKVLLAQGRWLEQRNQQRARIDNRAALRQLDRAGLRPFTPNRELQRHLETRARSLHQKLCGKLYDRALLDEVLRLISQRRGG